MDININQITQAEGGSDVSDVTNTVNIFTGVHHRPAQAPTPTQEIVNRPEIDTVKEQLLHGTSGILAVTAIHGQGGIGKTVVATAIANDEKIKETFTDGILWGTLGQTPDIMVCLGSWINDLGDWNYKVTNIETASKHLRTLLAGKKILLIIDDVWTREHARPLLAGDQNSRVLITTRRIYVADGIGAHTIPLDIMTLQQALALFALRLERVLTDSERTDAEEFAHAVGYLPLALEQGVKRIKSNTRWHQLTDAIRQEVARLDALGPGRFMPEDDVRIEASFNLSLKALKEDTEEAWRCFIHLGVYPEDVLINPLMVSALREMTVEDAQSLLERLHSEAMLIAADMVWIDQQLWPTYKLHDLWHDMARNLLVSKEGLNISLDTAHVRLLDCYSNNLQTERTNSPSARRAPRVDTIAGT